MRSLPEHLKVNYFSACVLLWSISSILGVNLKCEDEHRDYLFYSCKQPPGSNGNFTLPGDLPKTIESLSIAVDQPNSTWVVTQLHEFNPYTSLDTLHINTSRSWYLSEPHSIQNWKSKLFEVPSLQILRIIYVKGYNDVQHSWTLPEKLKHLYLENSVMDFDLRSTDNLFSLSLINTSLTKIPDNNGLFELAILDLRNNPLDEISSLQLASFCSLEEINLRDAKIPACECKRINRLFDDIRKHTSTKFIARYKCTPSTDKNCTNNWDDVRKIRDSCLKETTWSLFRTIGVVTVIVGLAIVICIFFSVWLLKSGSK